MLQIIDEFVRTMLALTVENLLQQFINLKQTGKDIPCECLIYILAALFTDNVLCYFYRAGKICVRAYVRTKY